MWLLELVRNIALQYGYQINRTCAMQVEVNRTAIALYKKMFNLIQENMDFFYEIKCVFYVKHITTK